MKLFVKEQNVDSKRNLAEYTRVVGNFKGLKIPRLVVPVKSGPRYH